MAELSGISAGTLDMIVEEERKKHQVTIVLQISCSCFDWSL